MSDSITMVLLDGDASAREGVGFLLRARPDCRVLATGAAIALAVRSVQAADPDVVLLNLTNLGNARLALLTALRRESSRSRVVVMGMQSRDDEVACLVRAGASGFLMAEAGFDRMSETIRAVARQTSVLPPELVHSLFIQVASRRRGRANHESGVVIAPLEVAACVIPAA